MADIPNADAVAKLASLLAPGILILSVRARFRDAIQTGFSDKLISYALVSVVYNSATYPIFHAQGGPLLPNWLWQTLLSFVLPVFVGLCFAFFDQSERFYKVSERLGLKPAHHVLTAWDYTFPRTTATYVLVHLNDGSLVAGVWESGSFASSTTGERDVLISRLWQVSVEGTEWTPIDPPRSMLICGGTIRMIEFIKGTRNERRKEG